MKLILCKNCWDVVKLSTKEIRSCECGKCKGQYTDDLNAWYSGEHAVPLGINNFDLSRAAYNQPEKGMGRNFNAFVIPKECSTFKKIE